MPNWCHNTLTVSGDESHVLAFVERAKSAEAPLSFNNFVPEPPDDVLRELEEFKPCTMCGACGTLPKSPEQARARGARWYDWMASREDRTCNVCRGTKRERVGSEGWYRWRCEHWGTKWDAAFGEPFIALGSGDMDVELSVETKGATLTPEVAVFKFDTAWAPPLSFAEAVSEQYPDLEFTLRYGEPGEGFAGETRFIGGLTIEEVELSLDEVLAPEEMWF